MPQMAPYSWFLMNFLFTLIILFYIIMLNYIFPMKNMKHTMKIKPLYMISW